MPTPKNVKRKPRGHRAGCKCPFCRALRSKR